MVYKLKILGKESFGWKNNKYFVWKILFVDNFILNSSFFFKIIWNKKNVKKYFLMYTPYFYNINLSSLK
jgi:hypothetical protein